MKTQNVTSLNRWSVLTGIVTALFLVVAMVAAADDFTRSYHEKYTVQKGATLNLSNKFGDIHCQVWAENSVDITVTITVEAASQEKADKVMDKISVTLTGSALLVQGKTEVGSINDGNFSIDYDVMMPGWMNIDLNNSFGEIYLAEVEGSTKINLEYGSLKADALKGLSSDLTVKFSEADVEYFKDGEVSVEYGGFESEEAGNLKLFSRFSHIEIENSELLNLDSQYDKVSIGKASQVVVIGRFSGLEFDKITGNFEFDSQYGDVKVDYIGPGFGSGKVRNSFAGTDLTFDPEATFNVDAEVEFGDLDYPSSNSSLNKQTMGYTKNVYNGKLGSKATASGQLILRVKHAGVEINFAD